MSRRHIFVESNALSSMRGCESNGEWEGRYFGWSKKGQGELDFDLKFPYREWFYGDVKSDDVKKDVQGNLKESIDFLVKEKNGRLWYVAISFEPEKDADHGYVTTRWWNR